MRDDQGGGEGTDPRCIHEVGLMEGKDSDREAGEEPG